VRADESVVQEKIQALRKLLSRNAQLLIAYSGGVDSTFLLAEATCAASGEGLLALSLFYLLRRPSWQARDDPTNGAADYTSTGN
jgi:PP-loop superfamily ATP-utilizing enzyme